MWEVYWLSSGSMVVGQHAGEDVEEIRLINATVRSPDGTVTNVGIYAVPKIHLEGRAPYDQKEARRTLDSEYLEKSFNEAESSGPATRMLADGTEAVYGRKPPEKLPPEVFIGEKMLHGLPRSRQAMRLGTALDDMVGTGGPRPTRSITAPQDDQVPQLPDPDDQRR